MGNGNAFREQLESLHAISVEIAALRDISDISNRALGYCLELTESEFAFTGLLTDDHLRMDVAAIRGFEPATPEFYAQFHEMAVRPSVVSMTITEQRPVISNDVSHDSHSVGTPPGHPPIDRFLGVPLRVGSILIGMIGVANRQGGYCAEDERLLQTFANQVAVAIDNARLYDRQRDTIAGLQELHERLQSAERDQVLEERERIAEELHGRIGQVIFTIGLRLGVLIDEVPDPNLAARLHELRRMTIEAGDEVRSVIFSLTVPGQMRSDLTSSVRALLRELEASHELQTELVVTGGRAACDTKIDEAVYVVIREALINVGRHADASVVLVSLRHEEASVRVVVQDDGVGFPAEVLRDYQGSYLHFGLRHMRDRLLALGGSLELGNGEEAGATVKFDIPVPPPT